MNERADDQVDDQVDPDSPDPTAYLYSARDDPNKRLPPTTTIGGGASRERELQRGSRADLVAALEAQAIGWWHLAKDDLFAQAQLGAEQLRTGAASVRVGHTIYEPDDELPDTPSEQGLGRVGEDSPDGP